MSLKSLLIPKKASISLKFNLKSLKIFQNAHINVKTSIYLEII
jgi:hypothetical protein